MQSQIRVPVIFLTVVLPMSRWPVQSCVVPHAPKLLTRWALERSVPQIRTSACRGAGHRHDYVRSRHQNTEIPGESWAARQTREDLVRTPDWWEALSSSLSAACPNQWEERPNSLYWTLVFMVLAFAKTLGGYCGRAAFARQCGSRPLTAQLKARRERAAAEVSKTFEAHAGRFPAAAKSLQTVEGRPSLAVVLPVYCRSEADVAEFRRTLAALAEQTLSPDLVVVVDDASPADSAPALGAWLGSAGFASVRMSQNCGPAGARSVGLRLLRHWAQGRHVVACLTDSDAVPDRGWCEAMLDAQMRNPGIVSGLTFSAEDSYAGRFHDHFGSLNGRWTWQDPPGVLLFGPTCNLSVSLVALDEMEFDPVFPRPGYEDVEFCWRARMKHGVLTRFCARACIYHEYDTGIAGVYGQFFKHGQTQPIMTWIDPTLSFAGSREAPHTRHGSSSLAQATQLCKERAA
mmetsp:Transcript_93733/g.260956  ORF Transcript_93733/g.260956 Transcript_93733/m.260956 type:complete len:460 (+) Transcript_93733:3-1382(+)